jgi:hypothetical protein
MASLSSLNYKLTANISPFKKGLNKAGRAMDQMGRKMQKFGKTMSMSVTAPLLAMGGASFAVFKNFEAEMSKVKAVSGATAEEFKALSDNAKKLGASTMFSASQVAQLQTEFAKLGFSATEITKVTESTLALAQASGSDLARAAEVAGSTLRAFGLDANETGRVTDVMAASFSTSALDMDKFAESMKYVAPVAKSAGMSLEQTSAMLAVLANNGIKGSQAGTALRRIISDLGATGGDVEGAIANLAKTGLNLADAKDEVGRSAQSALLILAEGVDQIDPLTQSFENSAGAAQDMADIMGDTAFGAGKRLESAMEGLGISLGEIIAEAVVPMVEGIAVLVGKLNDASPGAKRFAVAFGAVAAVIGPAVYTVGGLIRNFTALKTAITASSTATKIATAVQKAFNLAIKSNPVGAAVAGVVALGAAIFAYSQKKKAAADIEEEYNDAVSDEIATMEVRKSTANDMLELLKDENLGSKERSSIIKDLNKNYGDYLPKLLTERDSVLDIANAQKHLNEQMAKRVIMMAAQEQLEEATQRAVNAMKQMVPAQRKLNEALAKYKKATGETIDQQTALRIATTEATHPFWSLAQEVSGAYGEFGMYETTLEGAKLEMATFTQQIDMLSDAVTDGSSGNIKFTSSIGDAGDEAEETGGKVEDLKEKIDDLKISEVSFNEGIFEDLEEDVEQFDNSFTRAYERAKLFGEKYKELGQGIANVMHGASVDTIAGMAAIAGAMVVGEASFADLRQFALAQFAGLLEQLGKMFIQYGISVEGFVKALALGPTPMAAALAVGAGVAMIAAAGAIRSKMKSASEGSIPAMAEGGIVTGPTLALIGEGRESEAVIPLSKLNNMIQGGSQQVEVVGRISGADILLSQERAQRNRTRQRGF